MDRFNKNNDNINENSEEISEETELKKEKDSEEEKDIPEVKEFVESEDSSGNKSKKHEKIKKPDVEKISVYLEKVKKTIKDKSAFISGKISSLKKSRDKEISEEKEDNKFKTFLNKYVNILKEKLGFLLEFYRTYKIKCLLSALAALVILLIIAIGMGWGTNNLSERAISNLASNVDIEENSNDDIVSLIESYYTAVVDGDMDTLTEILDDTSGISESSLEQTLIEGYYNITCYIADGLNDNEYAVYIYWEVKILNIDTMAPGLETKYVVYDEDTGEYKIKTDYESDEKISEYLVDLAQRDEIQTIKDNTESAFAEALESDESLKILYEAMQESTTDDSTEEDTTTEDTTTEDDTSTDDSTDTSTDTSTDEETTTAEE